MATAAAAQKAARQSKQRPARSDEPACLAEAQFRERLSEKAHGSAMHAAELFKALGQPSGAGARIWAAAAAHSTMWAMPQDPTD